MFVPAAAFEREEEKSPPPPYQDRYNTDRPGSDYRCYLINSADPVVCRHSCAADPKCKSWAYVKPIPGKRMCEIAGTCPRSKVSPKQRVKPVCCLKAVWPHPIEDSCCVSGISRHSLKVLQAKRPGPYYYTFEIANYPEHCDRECKNDNSKCRAWVLKKPTTAGGNARCYLYSTIPDAQPDKCCSTGVNPLN